MASIDGSDAVHQLEATQRVRIAQLSPDLPELSARAVRGIVAIIWPYNSVKNSSAFILAEPEFRLRRSKGQVRINFSGSSAKAISQCNLGSTDEVLLSLDGAVWEADESRNGIPGASIGWQLKFSEKLSLQVKLGSSDETRVINIDHPPLLENGAAPMPSEPASPVLVTAEPEPQANLPTLEQSPVRDVINVTPEKRVSFKPLDDGEFESPAFVKRARVSYGSLFEGGFDIFEEDGGVKGGGRKRTRFGRDSGAWRYSSQSRSSSPQLDIIEKRDTHSVDGDKPQSSSSHPEGADEEVHAIEGVDSAAGTPTEESLQHKPLDYSFSAVRTDESASNRMLVDPEPPDSSLSAWETPASVAHPTLQDNRAFPSDQQQSAPTGSVGLNTAHDHFQQDWWHPVERHVAAYGGFSNNGIQQSLHQPSLVSQPIFGVHTPPGPLGRGLDHANLHEQEVPPTSPDKDIHPESHSARATEFGAHSDLAHQPVHYPPLDMMEHEPKHEMIYSAEQPSDEPYHSSHLLMADEGGDSCSNTLNPTFRDASDQGATLTTHAATPGAWNATNDPQSVSHTALDQHDTGDGNTPHSAVVIGESESDGETGEPEPAAPAPLDNHEASVTGTGSVLEQPEGGRLNTFRQESVGAYSDESESFPDEKSEGDYDTSLRPADDEDDIDDNDLRRRSFEPEFDEGDNHESWDEDDYGDDSAGSRNYDSEYENIEEEIEEQEEEEKRPPYPVRPSTTAPEVIDLISSSEDEDEVEEEGTEEDKNENDNHFREHDQDVNKSPPPGPQKALLPSDHRVSPEYGPEIDSQSSSGSSGSEAASAKGDEDYEDMGSDREAEAEEVDDEGFEQDVRREASELISESGQDREAKSQPEEDSQRSGEEVRQTTSPDPATLAVERSTRSTSPQRLPEALESSEPVMQVDSPEQVPDADGDAAMVDTIDLELDEKEAPRDVESHESFPEEQVVHARPPASNTRRQLHIRETGTTEAAPASPPLTQSFHSQIADKELGIVVQHTSFVESVPSSIDQVQTLVDIQHAEVIKAPESAKTTEDIDKNVVDEGPANLDFKPFKPNEEQGEESDTLLSKQEPESLGQESPADSDVVIAKDVLSSVDARTQPNEEPISLRAATAVSEANSFKSQMEADDELQASLMKQSSSQPEEAQPIMPNIEAQEVIQHEEDVNAPQLHEEITHISSPILGATPRKAQDKRREHPMLGSPVSRRLRRANQGSPKEAMNIGADVDSSVQLARASLGSKKADRPRDVTPEASRPQTRSRSFHESPATPIIDKTTQVEKAALIPSKEEQDLVGTSQIDSSPVSKKEEEVTSVTESKLKIVRLLRDELKEYTTLKVLRQHIKKTVEVMAVAMMTPANPQRAKGGPREYMMSFTTTDHTIGPNAVAEVQLYRPHKESLPVIKAGDVVLLRNFTVESMKGKGFGLRTNEGSSWAVFEKDFEPAQIKGPPVEYGEADQRLAASLREWYALLDEKARQKLEKANQKIIEAGRSK